MNRFGKRGLQASIVTRSLVLLATILVSAVSASAQTQVTTNGGTIGKIPKWTAGSALGDSIITDAGGAIEVGGHLSLRGPTPVFYMFDTAGTPNQRQFYFWNSSGVVLGRWVNDANEAPVLAESIAFKNNGNVGIGTTNPTSRFHLHDSSANVASDRAGSYFFMESRNNTGSPINNTHSVISVEGKTWDGFQWAGQIGVKAVVGSDWGGITDAKAFYAQGKTRLNFHSIGTYTGFYADTPTAVSNSSITTAHGVYVAAQKNTNVLNGFGIYQAGSNDNNYFSGKIGIGTTTPYNMLHTKTNDAPNHLVVDSGSTTGQLSEVAFFDRGVFKWELAKTPDNHFGIYDSAAGQYRVFVKNDGNVGIGTITPTAKLHVAGDISATGTIFAKYQDVAEWVPTRQSLEAGTVVILDSSLANHVLASSSAYDTRVAGVVSAKPGLILGEGGDGKVMVATTGRVRIKVDATRAPIRVGDLLVTSEREGYAMRSEPVDLGGTRLHRPGTLIGKALESLASGTGEILVLLSLQ
jgi:hypothetical protein